MKTLEELRNPRTNILSPKFSQAEQFVYYVFDDIRNIRDSFFDIGFRLKEAAMYNYQANLFDGKYKHLSIGEFAEEVFGIKKSTAYNLIEVANTYRGKSNMHIDERWSGYSQSQLVEMLPMEPTDRRYVSVNDTVADIRALKKEIKSGGSGRFRGLTSAKDCLTYCRRLEEAKNEDKEVEGAIEVVAEENSRCLENEEPFTVMVVEEVPKLPFWQERLRELNHDMQVFECNHGYELNKKRRELVSSVIKMLTDFELELIGEKLKRPPKIFEDLGALLRAVSLFRNTYLSVLGRSRFTEISDFYGVLLRINNELRAEGVTDEEVKL